MARRKKERKNREGIWPFFEKRGEKGQKKDELRLPLTVKGERLLSRKQIREKDP